MKNEKIFFFLVFFWILLAGNAMSLGISSDISITFSPNFKNSYQLCVKNSQNNEFPVVLNVEGPISEFITLQKYEYVLAPKEIKCQSYTIELPEDLDLYGSTTTKIWVKQISSTNGGAFKVLSNIHQKVKLFVPYPDKYVEIKTTAEDVNINEPVMITIQATNYGIQRVMKANARLDIYGADDYTNYVSSLYTSTKSIESMETVEYIKSFETIGLVPGYYKANVNFFYDSDEILDTEIFKIGVLFVKINNYTTTAVTGKINPYHIDIESRWNNEISEVYGIVEFEGIQKPILTRTISLAPWEKTTFKNYIDLTGVLPGQYNGKIRISFDNETNEKDVILNVLETTPIVEKPQGFENTDEPEAIESAGLTLTNILLILILIFIIGDIVYLYSKNRKNEE